MKMPRIAQGRGRANAAAAEQQQKNDDKTSVPEIIDSAKVCYFEKPRVERIWMQNQQGVPTSLAGAIAEVEVKLFRWRKWWQPLKGGVLDLDQPDAPALASMIEDSDEPGVRGAAEIALEAYQQLQQSHALTTETSHP